MRRIPAVALACLLIGCAAGPDQFRHAWVDPATAPNREKYNQDLDECRNLSRGAYDDKRAVNRASTLETVGGASVGLVAGGVAAGPSGLAAGGVAGQTAVQAGYLSQNLDTLYATMRECVRSRGYTPLQ